MKCVNLIILSIILIFSNTLKADEIKVIKSEINNINISLDYGFFTVIELENELLNFITLDTKSLRAEKLNNKAIIVFPYDNNLPNSLGKLIINDSACNSYAINFLKGSQLRDQVINITNSNRQRTCNNDKNQYNSRFGNLANTKILYSNK